MSSSALINTDADIPDVLDFGLDVGAATRAHPGNHKIVRQRLLYYI